MAFNVRIASVLTGRAGSGQRPDEIAEALVEQIPDVATSAQFDKAASQFTQDVFDTIGGLDAATRTRLGFDPGAVCSALPGEIEEEKAERIAAGELKPKEAGGGGDGCDKDKPPKMEFVENPELFPGEQRTVLTTKDGKPVLEVQRGPFVPNPIEGAGGAQMLRQQLQDEVKRAVANATV